jgi:hypothetical protein
MGKRLVTDIEGATGNTSKISVLPRATVTPQPTVCRLRTDRKGKNRDRVEEYILINAATGEEVERYVLDGRVMPKPGDWARIYQSFAEQLSRDANFPIATRALWLIVARAGFGNLARINVSAVAAEWGVNRQHLSESLSNLVAERVIERAKGGTYRLNPNFIWKGDYSFRASMCARWDQRSEPEPATQADRQAGGCENG